MNTKKLRNIRNIPRKKSLRPNGQDLKPSLAPSNGLKPLPKTSWSTLKSALPHRKQKWARVWSWLCHVELQLTYIKPLLNCVPNGIQTILTKVLSRWSWPEVLPTQRNGSLSLVPKLPGSVSPNEWRTTRMNWSWSLCETCGWQALMCPACTPCISTNPCRDTILCRLSPALTVYSERSREDWL